MFKEKVKTSIIIILLINLVFLTYQAWFKSGIVGSDWSYFSVSDLPFVRFFMNDTIASVPKENLSKPRKIVVNDGELWVPYYNTDDAFDNLNEKTRQILEALLQGRSRSEKKISYSEWLSLLAEPGVYVEYPISVAPKMLSMVLNTSFEKLPAEIEIMGDAIITPFGNEAVQVAVRDMRTNTAYRFLIEDEEIAFPQEVLAMYTERYSRDGYYEFAFNTLLNESLGAGNVKIADLVLFSDNESTYRDIEAENPIEDEGHERLLRSFSFNPKPLRRYSDKDGAVNYVENYATVTIFPEGYVEYSAVDEEKGIELGSYEDNHYETLNRAIDFAEKVWASVSDKPLNVLVSGIEETEDGSRFIFDYYYGGREIAVEWQKADKDALYHAIEIVTSGNRIVSYRQYLREYTEAESFTGQENFIPALDYFVEAFANSENTVITDLYPGYFDKGAAEKLKTTWLCEINNSDARYPKEK